MKYVKSSGALKYSRRNLLRKQDSGAQLSGGIGLTKGDRRFNWNRSNTLFSSLSFSLPPSLSLSLSFSLSLSLLACPQASNPSNRRECDLASLSHPSYNVFPGFLRCWRWSGRKLAAVSPAASRESTPPIANATRATAPLTLTAGIRERLSRAILFLSLSLSLSLRVSDSERVLLFIFLRCCDLSSPRYRDSVNICEQRRF